MTNKNGYPIVRIAMSGKGKRFHPYRFAHAIREGLYGQYPGLIVETVKAGKDDYSTCAPADVILAVASAVGNPDSYEVTK